MPVTIVGYGASDHQQGGVGSKRTVTTGVDAFNDILLEIGNAAMQTCHGDSGGPAFQNGLVVGVTSFGSDPAPNDVCEGGGFDIRVDAEIGFISANTF